MNAVGAPTTSLNTIRKILSVIVVFALLFYAWLMFDLLAHPFDTGSNATFNPFLFRWFSAASGTFSVIIALFVLRKSPGNFLGLLLVIWGVGAAGWSGRIDLGSQQANNLVLVGFNLYFFILAFPSLVALMFHFPDGQVHPVRLSGWAWGLVLFQAVTGIVAIWGVTAYQSGSVTNPMYIPALRPYALIANILMATVGPLAGVVSLGLRYRAGGERERQQIKWLMWLAAVAVGYTIFLGAAFEEAPDGSRSDLYALLRIIGYLYWQIFPAIAIAIAVLRYRLWDIDVIIRRTLQWGALSVVLGLVYFGLVVVLGQAFQGVTGQQQPLAVVVSTLVIAALFTPLRRRIQETIDRRFYRQKYDAAIALDEFSSATRQEVELSSLTTRLVGVVEKTVQPEQVSVWLRDRRMQV